MVLWVTLLLILAPAAWCFGAQAVGTDTSLFSLDVKGEQLGTVLEQIKKKTGYTVSLDKEWLTAPVNVRFEQQQLGSGLQRVFESVGIKSHAMKIDNEKKSVTVFVVDGDAPTTESENSAQRDLSQTLAAPAGWRPPEEVQKIVASRNQPSDVDPSEQTLWPAGDDGKTVMTIQELRAFKAEEERASENADPLDQQLFPFGANGKPGLTVRELKAIRESASQQMGNTVDLDQPIFPTRPDGKVGITLGELKAIQAAQAKQNASTELLEQIVVPPSDSGGKGLTLRELKIIRRGTLQ